MPVPFIIMHKTSPHWEAGAIPDAALLERVGQLIGEMSASGEFVSGEGLRASSLGLRLRFSGGIRTIVHGPFTGDNELPAGFDIVQVASLDDAVERATRQAAILGDVEIDIRPVTEPWDIGLAPKPAHATSQRYMLLRKATAATESGAAPTKDQRAALIRLTGEKSPTGVALASIAMRPSARGRRYRNSASGVRVMDGPFIESKELIAGYVIVSSSSLDDASRWAAKYIVAVAADEVDVRELEEG
jgi:hypothetical protein